MKGFPKEQRNRLLVVAAGTTLALAAIWFGPVSFLKNSLAKLDKQLSEQEFKVSNAERLVKSKDEIEKNLQVVGAQIKQVEQNMAAGDMYAWIILTVNKFRADHRVNIPQFSREVTGDVALFPKFPYKAATFTVRGTGFFHDVGRFIADFENTFPYLSLQNLELEPSTANATTNSHPELLAFKMDIQTLINPNPL